MVVQGSSRRIGGMLFVAVVFGLALMQTHVVTPSPCTYLEPGTFLYWLYGCDDTAGGGGGGAK